MKISGFNSEYSVRAAASDGFDRFLEDLENAGRKISACNFYSASIKHQFASSCQNAFVDPENFTILPGSRYLIKHIMQDVCNNKFNKKVRSSSNSQNTRESSEDPIEVSTYFTRSNIEKLNLLLKKNWVREELPFGTPKEFLIHESSKTSWIVTCTICRKSLKVFLSRYKDQINFNTAGFMSHVKLHKQKGNLNESENSTGFDESFSSTDAQQENHSNFDFSSSIENGEIEAPPKKSRLCDSGMPQNNSNILIQSSTIPNQTLHIQKTNPPSKFFITVGNQKLPLQNIGNRNVKVIRNPDSSHPGQSEEVNFKNV